jgi:hypothetical protein
MPAQPQAKIALAAPHVKNAATAADTYVTEDFETHVLRSLT